MRDRPEMLQQHCVRCGARWAGMDRAHCRTCCHTFDDAALFDTHRRSGICLDGQDLDLVQTKNGIWVRLLKSA